MATALSAAIPAGQTGRQETLSEWAGPYVTSMLGKAQALSEMPYQTYQGPLTAGASPLQMQAFTQAGGLGTPSDVTGAASTLASLASGTGQEAYTPGTFGNQFKQPASFTEGEFGTQFTAPATYQPIGGSFTDEGIAKQFMNPYMQQVLAPQLQQMQRQADIQRTMLGPQMARAGFGSRSGLMGQQLNAELMRQQQQATGQAYGQAYTQGLGQFNLEQQRKAQEAQFKNQQQMQAAQLAAQYGLAGQQAREASRQFGAQQAMQAAQLGAQYGLAGQQAAEQAKQFGASYGLQGLAQRLQAAQARGALGATQADIARQNLASMLGAGQMQRDIEQQGVAADLAEFQAQRDYPYKMLQFQQSMLQGMPIQSIAAQYQQPSTLTSTMNTMGGLMNLYNMMNPKATTTKTGG